jgi:CspA family cold shock protein
VPKKRSGTEHRLWGTVKWFDADEGWGVITSPDVPGDCFVHFSCIQADGYRELRAGQQVTFTYEETGAFLQDGCPFRALAVWP